MVNEEQFINGSEIGHQVLNEVNQGLNEFQIHSCEKIDKYEEGLAKQSTINNNGKIPADGVLSINGAQKFIHMVEVSVNRTPPENVKANTNIIRPLHKILNNMYTFKLPIYGQTLTNSNKDILKEVKHLELVSHVDYKNLANNIIKKCNEGKGTYHLKNPKIQNERNDGYNPVAFHFPISSVKSGDKLILDSKGQSRRLSDFGSNVNLSNSDALVTDKIHEIIELSFDEYIKIANLWFEAYASMANFDEMSDYQREKFGEYVDSVRKRYIDNVCKSEFEKNKHDRINEIKNCLNSTPKNISLQVENLT